MFQRTLVASRLNPNALLAGCMSARPFLVAFAVFSFGVVGPTKSSHGEIQIAIQSGTIVEGGTATIDVLITTTIINQLLSEFDANFLINQSNATAGTALEFTDPQTQVGMQTEAFVDDPRYVFFLNATQTGSDAKFQNLAATMVAPSTTLNVLDLAVDAVGDLTAYPIQPGDFLAQFRLTHDLGGAAPGSAVGDTFAISLDENYNDLQFLDAIGDDITFTTTPGTITVIAAVPEPSSVFALAAILGTPLLMQRRRR